MKLIKKFENILREENNPEFFFEMNELSFGKYHFLKLIQNQN